jgi:bacteriocin-like protein
MKILTENELQQISGGDGPASPPNDLGPTANTDQVHVIHTAPNTQQSHEIPHVTQPKR